MSAYAELQVTSNYSFLRGASHPEELVREAHALGYRALALTDRNTLAGVVRAHRQAKALGMRFIVGSRLDLQSGQSLLCFPVDRAAYGRLCRLLTRGKRRAEKAQCRLAYEDLVEFGEGQIVIALPPDKPDAAFSHLLDRLRADFADAYLAAQHLYRGDDAKRLHRLAALAARKSVPLVATNEVLYHVPRRRPLQDVVTCIREGCAVAEAGFRLLPNAERHLKPPEEMARLFRDYPNAVARTLEIAQHCRFNLDELRYEYPDEIAPDGTPPQEALEKLAWKGVAERYPEGVPEKIRTQIEHELQLIGQLGYAPYFLTVDDIVREARRRGILCQGRGSAANSAVCYCLGITSVDPSRLDLLFERFISTARNEPPDIDVDFEHERREEVIQYIYDKYGRHRAALAATVICYRPRFAIREVGKAMGLSVDVTAALAGTVWGWGGEGLEEAHIRALGLDPSDPTLRLALDLAAELIGFPRHLSQHVGGFVITRGLLEEVVPIENAAMEERTVVEWDKDDLDTLGILKIDVLALGMLSCIRRAFDLIEHHYGKSLTIASVPQDDPAVYKMLGRADSVGVFQVESRAQMSMLPRLRPKNFYDLVIEVAIVRPGPIQGDMVHPYLRRREGKEKPDYPSEALRKVLEKTLGVPLFQEQAMNIAIVAAGFEPEEADRLRRSMATFRHTGKVAEFRDKFIDGMVANKYKRDFAERCFKQIEGFGEYGFPESHAASFALLVYVSGWIKWFYPEVFACALLNSQPMGFYAPAQIVRDAREHGVEVREVDVNASQWDCTLEPAGKPGRWALRLGLRRVKGFAQEAAQSLVARRGEGYADPAMLAHRAGLDRSALEKLAAADGFRSMQLDRRAALWAVKGLEPQLLPLFAPLAGTMPPEPEVRLPAMSLGEHVVEDYATLGLSLKRHPLALLRPDLDRRGIVPAGRLKSAPAGSVARVAGLVLVRQRPGSASGVIFMTLEDETGIANLVVWPSSFERFRREVMTSDLVEAEGKIQRAGKDEHAVIHLVLDRLVDLTPMLRRLASDAELTFVSRDFH
jgi:error-prone DNA polymerase